MGAEEDPENNRISCTEMTTMMKSLFRAQTTTQDSYYQLTTPDQLIIFLLRTRHCKVLALSVSNISCREAEQTVEHAHQALRQYVWPQPADVQEKLYGSVTVHHL